MGMENRPTHGTANELIKYLIIIQLFILKAVLRPTKCDLYTACRQS